MTLIVQKTILCRSLFDLSPPGSSLFFFWHAKPSHEIQPVHMIPGHETRIFHFMLQLRLLGYWKVAFPCLDSP